MQLKPGDKLGPYEIVSAIGKGGMGEVWKARDPRLNRDVAVKISAKQFTDRFEREAQVVASLNHANICTLHDVGPNYLVMELVEGLTLAERIAQGPVPLEEALAIAKQIANGLEAAHEKNVVHRDLKPANVKIKPDGQVKVLDFGLAKSGEVAELTPDSPTMLTVHGMILGTAGYMAPEQAAGQPVDKRADVWAFGVVLYEILTGQRLLQGDSVAHILADVLRGPIDLDKLPKETPRRIRNLMKRCLDRDLRTRLRDIREARVAIEAADEEPEGATAAPARSRFGREGWIAAVAIPTALLAALGFVHFRERPPDPQVLRYTIALPEKTAVDDFAISPDGRSVAIRGLSANGSQQLWVRPLDSLQPRTLPGTEGASYPFWSPDSRYIGFFANGKLKKVTAAGGPPQTLCDADNVRGGAWSPEGVIVFSPLNQGGLSRVSAAGGVPVPVTKAGPGSGSDYLLFPVFLPDGRRFLYTSTSGASPGIYLGSLDSATTRRIAPDLFSKAQYMPPTYGSRNSYLLFVREGTLMAQPVDPRTLDAAGDLIPLAEHVTVSRNLVALFSLSPGGFLIYDASGGTEISQPLSWFDREGKLLKSFGSPGIVDFALSPDEKKLALERRTSPEVFPSDLWVADLEHGTESRLTFNNGTTRAFNPVWSPDGSRVAFRYADRSNIFLRNSNGTGQEQVLLESKEQIVPWDWSRDGKFLIFSSTKTGGAMGALPLTDEGSPGDRKPIPLVGGEFRFFHGQVSPDGRWLAYASNESGRFEVYVQPFAPAPQKPPEGKWQISTGGGNQPRWRADGKELFYQALDAKIMAADVRATGTTFDHGTPQPLFEPRMNPDMVTAGGFHYVVSADGKRFLIRDIGTGYAAQPLTVVVNWLAAVKK